MMTRSSFIYSSVASAPMVQPLSSLFQRMPETIARSSSPKTSVSMIEAMVRISLSERVVWAFSQSGSILAWKLARAFSINSSGEAWLLRK